MVVDNTIGYVGSFIILIYMVFFQRNKNKHTIKLFGEALNNITITKVIGVFGGLIEVLSK